ncbi:MAG: N-acetylmuramoyl-L-alanine amidase [Clostridiales bacterium]|nr:N-acetylmuramoyl-L-alanine amidase [Clostridiales bacterium]
MANRIMIDAGHNGLTDPGAVFNGRRESDDTLRLARAVGEILSRNGYDVSYTRTGDLDQSVIQKAQLANDTDVDLLVSLHRNMASYPGQYDGVQTLIYDRSGFKQLMAENINQNLEGVGFRNINVETRPNLAVLRRTRMPALLVEAGFIDSEIDNNLFDTRFDEIAQAIADGIMDTLNAEDSASDPPRAYAYQPPVSQNRGFFADPSMSAGNSWQLMQDMSSGQDMGNPRPLYRVQVGAFYNLQNAIELEQELKRMGYNTWIVTI